MNDIENLDVDETKIINPYANNSYWSNNQTEDIDLDEYEFQKELKEYIQTKESIRNLIQIMNYRLEKLALILACTGMFLLYILSVVCAILSYKTGELATAEGIIIAGCVCAGLGLYCIIEIGLYNSKMPFRRLKFWKDFTKSIRKNRKKILKMNRTLKEPRSIKERKESEDFDY